ncbi:MAG TPA: hypothetical protein VNS60_12205 [Solirubrobacterales bacterium]|nr:hypothetical protein [Solirubrobacterales bacterium]
MFSTLRNRFGIPGVISVIALVFAMFGGAYAASNSSGGGKATASAKAKKGPRGPKGATGPAGPAGAAGPAGIPGAKGEDGEDGEDGKNGKNGTNGVNGIDGTSVANTEFSGAEGPCEEGGTKLVGTATTYACNGEQGVEGSPWTVGGVLPPGKTETGAWTFGVVPTSPNEPILTSISFPIPLPTALGGSEVHYRGKGAPTTECPGSVSNPQAAPGHLCFYTGEELGTFTPEILNPDPVGEYGASKAGALLMFLGASKSSSAYGTWAVTAPTAP